MYYLRRGYNYVYDGINNLFYGQDYNQSDNRNSKKNNLNNSNYFNNPNKSSNSNNYWWKLKVGVFIGVVGGTLILLNLFKKKSYNLKGTNGDSLLSADRIDFSKVNGHFIQDKQDKSVEFTTYNDLLEFSDNSDPGDLDNGYWNIKKKDDEVKKDELRNDELNDVEDKKNKNDQVEIMQQRSVLTKTQ